MRPDLPSLARAVRNELVEIDDAEWLLSRLMKMRAQTLTGAGGRPPSDFDDESDEAYAASLVQLHSGYAGLMHRCGL